MLAQTVRITDNFSFKESRIQEVEEETVVRTCTSFIGLIGALSIFLVAQVIVLMAWSYLWHKKRATKQVASNMPTAADIYFATTSSRSSCSSYLPN